MLKYYKLLKKKLEELEELLPKDNVQAFRPVLSTCLRRFLKRMKYWTWVILGGNLINGGCLTIGSVLLGISIPLIIFGLSVAPVGWALVMPGIVIGIIGAGIIFTGILSFLLTNNPITYYKLGKTIGRLEQKSKEMLHKYPIFKKNILEISASKIGITPKFEEINNEVFKQFKNQSNERLGNKFIAEAIRLFDDSGNTSPLIDSDDIDIKGIQNGTPKKGSNSSEDMNKTDLNDLIKSNGFGNTKDFI